MSSPSSVGGNNASVGIRDGTRVILREITANLQNSPPGTSPRRKTGNEASPNKVDQQQQHDVKVRFIREFADATSSTSREGIPESSSLSSASSFQSLASTLSSKCSSGICVDSSPSKIADRSYLNADISGLDDLISACENIRLDDTTKEESFELRVNSEKNSPDETFTSATDRASLDRTRENSPINCPDEDCHNFNVTTEVRRENSPIYCRNEADHSLNVTTDIERENSPINCPNEADRGLDIVTEVRRENSPINCPNEANRNLNLTTEIRRESSPINCRNEENPDLNITTEIRRENSPINRPNEENPDLKVTTEIESEICSKNRPNQSNIDLNVTTEITREDSATNRSIQVNSDLNVTTVITGENLALISTNQAITDLNVTREIAGENPSLACPYQDYPDLDKTRDVTREVSLINTESDGRELEKTRAIDGETKASLANADLECNTTVDIGEENRGCSEVEKSRETFFQCVSDIAQFSASNGSEVSLNNTVDEPVLAKTDFSAGTLKLTSNKNDEGLERYEELPLELVTPSLSQFLEKLAYPRTEDRVEKTQTSSVETLSSVNIVEFKETTQHQSKHVDLSSSLINEFTGNTRCPSLPTLSSIYLPADLNETKNLLPQKVPTKNADNIVKISAEIRSATREKIIEETPLAAPSVSEKFAALAGNEDFTGNSLSTIQEPSFLGAQNLVDSCSIEKRDEETRKSEVSPISEENNLGEIGNSKVLEIDKDSSASRSIVEESRVGTSQVEKSSPARSLEVAEINEKLLAKKQDGAVERAESEVPNVDIDKESFPEVGDKRENSDEDLDTTVTVDDLGAEDIRDNTESNSAKIVTQRDSASLVSQPQPLESYKSTLVAGSVGGQTLSAQQPVTFTDEYAEFQPQKQSTTLDNFLSPISSKLERQRTPFVTAPILDSLVVNGQSSRTSPKKLANIIDDRCNFAKLELAANSVANDIFNTSIELAEENEHFVSAESDLFDFLLSKTPRKNTKRDLRAESLYVKFDPLVSNTSMLPQGNIQNASPPANEARNGDNNPTIANIGTPKRNPAIAAIDRLLFYSPMSTNTTPTNTNATIQNTNDTQEKLKPTQETSEETINMAKELELVRTTVLQLEEQLEKLKIDHDEALEKQTSYKEKINQLQTQLAQEIKNKNEITVVVDEYEISISRLVAERERDRKNLDLEKAKLQEELAAAKHHLDNTEAAFNDVHLKYERLKAVVATYKSNETALKESLQENVEIIKSLENRYEQVKSHATAKLEKANQDLDAIRKQNEGETVRLHAMLRKAELKSNSLAELVEQKTKENKELAQILDEVIARVGLDKSH